MDKFKENIKVIILLIRVITYCIIGVHLLYTSYIIYFNKQDDQITQEVYTDHKEPYNKESYTDLNRFMYTNITTPRMMEKLSLSMPFKNLTEKEKRVIEKETYKSICVETERIWYLSDMVDSIMFILIFLALLIFWWYIDRFLGYTCLMIISLQFSDIFAISMNFKYFYKEYYLALFVGAFLLLLSIRKKIRN